MESIYLLDVIVRFFISFMDVSNGDEIFSVKRIGARYLRGSFAIDFLSVIPLFFSSSTVAFFKILKLARITRIGDLIRSTNVNMD